MDTEKQVATNSTEIIKCIACQTGKMSSQTERLLFGLIVLDSIICDACGATLRKSGNDWKFAKINDKNNDIWKTYHREILTAREWLAISNDGMSDARQREADIKRWLELLSTGAIKISFKGVQTPVILRGGEEILFALPNVTLKEPRAVRKTRGGYAGPSFRVAKGVSFRMGSFASTSESHQEIRNIDSGILTVTSERLVFSGKMKTINVDLKKIVQVDPFTDGIALHKEGREKTQYLVWNQNGLHMQLSQSGRSYNEPVSGLILKCIMEGAIRKSN